MAIEYRERTIGNHLYRVTQLGAKSGRSMLVRLMKLLGPGAGSFLGGVGRAPGAATGEASEEAALALGIADALHDMAARLNEADVGALIDEFALHTVVVVSSDAQPRLTEIFDGHFAGRYDEMLKWLGFCMEINFHSFFAGGASRQGGLMQAWTVLSGLKSRSTSTGTSTASPPVASTPTA